MNSYIYILSLSERLYDDNAWTSEDEKAINDHFNRIKADYGAKKIIHVGRTVDPKNGGFGLVIFHADSLEEAIKYANLDPAVLGGQMTVKVFPYELIF